MAVAYLILAGFAAICFYLGSPHQGLSRSAAANPRLLRALGWTSLASSIFAAIAPFGLWAGVFSVQTVLMMILVLLPYLDASLRLRKAELT